MTQEEKARKYDEALERAKKELSISHTNSDSERQLYRLFPELAEDENELTWLTRYIEEEAYSLSIDTRDNEDSIKLKKLQKALTWLEKQGGIDNCPLEFSTNTIITDSKKNQVKPKFKVGDWINGYYTNYKVLSVNNKGYVVEDIHGNKINILFENEKFHHIWSIKDAKDGDVLVAPPVEGSEHSEQIFIFKEIKDREYVKNAVEYYCRCMDNEFAANERGFMGQLDDYFIPATEEQRDLLFQKIKEAGYEWDTKKKELKKMEQKSKWNDEDDNTLKAIIYTVRNSGYKQCIGVTNEKMLAWLEKQGEQKPTWSDTDKLLMRLDKIVDCNIDQTKCLNNIFDKLNEVIGKLGDIHEVLSKPFQFPYKDYTSPNSIPGMDVWYKTHGVERITPVTCGTATVCKPETISFDADLQKGSDIDNK